MLAYSYSKDHDIFSQEILQTSVRKTRKFLQSRGYEIFEEGKDGWFAQGGTFMHLKAETFLSNWKTEGRIYEFCLTHHLFSFSITCCCQDDKIVIG